LFPQEDGTEGQSLDDMLKDFNPFRFKRDFKKDIVNRKKDKPEVGVLEGALQLFRGKSAKATRISIGLCFLAAASGNVSILYYSAEVFQDLGLNEGLIISAVALPNIFGAFLALYLLDVWGRKPLLQFSFGTMAVSLGLLAAAISLQDTLPLITLPYFGETSPAKVACVTCLPIYVAAYSAGAGPIPWLLYNELFPTRLRARATALCTALNYAANVVVAQTFLPVLDAFGIGTAYYAYAAFCGVGLVFTNKYVIETKGLSLQQIEYMLAVGEGNATPEDGVHFEIADPSQVLIGPMVEESSRRKEEEEDTDNGVLELAVATVDEGNDSDNNSAVFVEAVVRPTIDDNGSKSFDEVESNARALIRESDGVFSERLR
jgi:hypothetical protein